MNQTTLVKRGRRKCEAVVGSARGLTIGRHLGLIQHWRETDEALNDLSCCGDPEAPIQNPTPEPTAGAAVILVAV